MPQLILNISVLVFARPRANQACKVKQQLQATSHSKKAVGLGQGIWQPGWEDCTFGGRKHFLDEEGRKEGGTCVISFARERPPPPRPPLKGESDDELLLSCTSGEACIPLLYIEAK